LTEKNYGHTAQSEPCVHSTNSSPNATAQTAREIAKAWADERGKARQLRYQQMREIKENIWHAESSTENSSLVRSAFNLISKMFMLLFGKIP
jgi:hypothetical protein